MEPVLELLRELDGKDAGDVPFVLAALRVRDRRVLEALTRRLENDPQDAALCLEMYGDPAAIPALEAALAQIPADDPRSRAPIQAVIESLSAPAEASPESKTIRHLGAVSRRGRHGLQRAGRRRPAGDASERIGRA